MFRIARSGYTFVTFRERRKNVKKREGKRERRKKMKEEVIWKSKERHGVWIIASPKFVTTLSFHFSPPVSTFSLFLLSLFLLCFSLSLYLFPVKVNEGTWITCNKPRPTQVTPYNTMQHLGERKLEQHLGEKAWTTLGRESLNNTWERKLEHGLNNYQHLVHLETWIIISCLVLSLSFFILSLFLFVLLPLCWFKYSFLESEICNKVNSSSSSFSLA